MQGTLSASRRDFPSYISGSLYILLEGDRPAQLLQRGESFGKDGLPIESIDKVCSARHIDADPRLWHFRDYFRLGFGPLRMSLDRSSSLQILAGDFPVEEPLPAN